MTPFGNRIRRWLPCGPLGNHVVGWPCRTAGIARKTAVIFWMVVSACLVVSVASPGYGWHPATADRLSGLIGDGDSVAVMDARHRLLYSKNIDQSRIPASTLKLLTGLVALQAFGPDYRFQTDVYEDNDHSVTVKGYGDPLLLSEVLSEMAGQLADRLTKPIAV